MKHIKWQKRIKHSHIINGNHFKIKNNKRVYSCSLKTLKIIKSFIFIIEFLDYIYDKVTEFNSYGFAGIKKDNKWGVINETGDIIIEPSYIIQDDSTAPEFLGQYYKIYYGYGENYYTDHKSE